MNIHQTQATGRVETPPDHVVINSALGGDPYSEVLHPVKPANLSAMPRPLRVFGYCVIGFMIVMTLFGFISNVFA